MSSKPKVADPGIGMRLALDLGPLVVYFIAFAATAHNIYIATALFMAVTAVAMVVSLVRYGKISPIQIFSAVMVLILGGLTIWLHKDWIIKIKPTIYYVTVTSVLVWGLITGRPTLQMVLGQAYPGLDEEGWRLLTRNWAFFFFALAVANEIVWRNSTTAFWLGYKLWGSMPATLIFAACNVPMLMRHGLAADDNKVVLPPEE
jgi:intracellular septation protein